MRRLLTGLAVALPLSLGCVAAGTTAADAAASSCTGTIGNPQGNTYAEAYNAKTTSITAGGRTLNIELRYSSEIGTGKQVAWSRVYASNSGDIAYLDISRDNTATHVKCGSRTSTGTYLHWSNAYYTSTSASIRFRACGGIKAGTNSWYVKCTAWW